jgi:hypothetical protein
MTTQVALTPAFCPLQALQSQIHQRPLDPPRVEEIVQLFRTAIETNALQNPCRPEERAIVQYFCGLEKKIKALYANRSF